MGEWQRQLSDFARGYVAILFWVIVAMAVVFLVQAFSDNKELSYFAGGVCLVFGPGLMRYLLAKKAQKQQ